jgi:hypothetical protein
VLKDQQGKKRLGNITTLQYLFEFLDAYDFGAEGGEEIQEDNKTLINASVLGLIFEKINGYSNEYWGWGAEDDDVLFRCNIMGVETFRKGCKYRSLDHERKIEHKPYMDNLDKLRLFHQNPTEEYILKDGLSTLEYEKTGTEKISDVTTVVKVKI